MKTASQLSVAILILTAIVALFGGYKLITDATGHALQMSLEDLKGTPFTDYSLPGWVLLIAIGLGSAVTAFVTLQHQKSYPYFIITEGIILLLWISIQTDVLTQVNFLQVIFGLFGLALILMGNMMRKKLKQPVHHAPVAHSNNTHHKRSRQFKRRKH